MRKKVEYYFTIDAGPNVHYLCRPEDSYELQKILMRIKGVEKTALVEPAQESQIIKDYLF